MQRRLQWLGPPATAAKYGAGQACFSAFHRLNQQSIGQSRRLFCPPPPAAAKYGAGQASYFAQRAPIIHWALAAAARRSAKRCFTPQSPLFHWEPRSNSKALQNPLVHWDQVAARHQVYELHFPTVTAHSFGLGSNRAAEPGGLVCCLSCAVDQPDKNCAGALRTSADTFP